MTRAQLDEPIDDTGRRVQPIVAIIGRPNVGKSTIFNRLVGKRDAIVHDRPGVTRDRHYGSAWALGRGFVVVDTGGLDLGADDRVAQAIGEQVQIAIDEADIVVCVFDAKQGPTDADRRAVSLLRRSPRPAVYVANKVDSESDEHSSMDLYALGVDRLVATSALHGRAFSELEEAIVAHLPAAETPEPQSEDATETVRFAVVGRPNAGKSSLVNRLAGQTRMLVDERPGTTRDPIDLAFDRKGVRYVVVDTAGIRRKSRVTRTQDYVEVVSVLRALRAMEHAEVAVVVCDAAAGVSEQETKIVGQALDRGRATVVALNKMDLLTATALRDARRQTHEALSFAPWVPIVHTSALTGRGTDTLLANIVKVRRNFAQRVPTGELNRFFEGVLETHPPPTHKGRAPRLYYVTQAESSPPLFVVMTNAPHAIHFSYQRYVTNQLRKHFGFEGVPLRVRYRGRK